MMSLLKTALADDELVVSELFLTALADELVVDELLLNVVDELCLNELPLQ